MAVTVMWEDDTERTFMSAIRIEQEGHRAPFYLINDENKYVAIIPDHRVKALLREDITTEAK